MRSCLGFAKLFHVYKMGRGEPVRLFRIYKLNMGLVTLFRVCRGLVKHCSGFAKHCFGLQNIVLKTGFYVNKLQCIRTSSDWAELQDLLSGDPGSPLAPDPSSEDICEVSTGLDSYLAMDLAEVCGGAARTSRLAVRRRLRAGRNFDLVTRCDLTRQEDREKADSLGLDGDRISSDWRIYTQVRCLELRGHYLGNFLPRKQTLRIW